MIGNDIIDLNVAGVNSRWQEQRFLDKLFSKEEIEFILSNEMRFETIWRLWSMKESAYKIYARENKAASFNPNFFHCEISSSTNGTVVFNGQKIQTNTTGNSTCIYTTAQPKNSRRISDYLVLNGASLAEKSKHLKKHAINIFAELKSVSKTAVSIQKNDFGAPFFLIHQQAQKNVLTLTHHGDFGGFAIVY